MSMSVFFDWILIAALGSFVLMHTFKFLVGLAFDGNDTLLRSRTEFRFGLALLLVSTIWRIIDPSIYSAPVKSHWFQMLLLAVAPLFLIGGLIGSRVGSRLLRRRVYVFRDKPEE